VKRETVVQLSTLAGIIAGSFLLHSCMAGPRYNEPLAVGEVASVPKICVGLGKFVRVEVAPLLVRGDFAIHGEKGVIDRSSGMDKAVELRWKNGILVGSVATGEPFVRIVPATDGDLEIGGIRYRGELHVFRDDEKAGGGPRITVANQVDLESYLKGVVGSEMSLSQHVEALKAQAIAARTYAMYEVKARTLRTVKNEKFDVYDDDRSQVYLGLKNEAAKAVAVVDATRGMFMTYQGRIFKTFFSSTCGGSTEPAHIVLGREAEDIPPLNGALCGDAVHPYCEGSKHFHWKAELLKADLVKKLFPDKPQIVIEQIEITRTLPGGHAWEVALTLAGTSRKVVMGANDGFRRRVDPRLIRSTLWEKIEQDAEKFVITGRGWGHGCGLCQYGAYRMAETGKSAVEICEMYYPQAKVQKLY
jgi:stage II sporulation protein D